MLKKINTILASVVFSMGAMHATTSMTIAARDESINNLSVVETSEEKPTKPSLVGSSVHFKSDVVLYETNGNEFVLYRGEHFSLISRNKSGVYRVYIPKANRPLYYVPNEELEPIILAKNSLLLGDLNYDHRVDSYDLCILKGHLAGTNPWIGGTTWAYFMADINGDNDITVADAVMLQKFLLGEEEVG